MPRVLTLGVCLSLLCLWLLMPASSHAQCSGITVVLQPLDEETVEVSSTAVALTPSKYQQSKGTAAFASIQIQGGAILYRLAGTPTTTEGATATAGQTLTVCGLPSLQALRFLRQQTDATLFVTYYRTKSP